MAGNERTDFLTLLRPVLRRSHLVGGIVFGSVLLALIYSLLATEEFKAVTTFMPLQSFRSSSMQGFGGVSQSGQLSSVFQALGGSSSRRVDHFIHILKSRTLAENVIRKTNLMPYLLPGKWDAKAKKWNTSPPPDIQEAVIEFFKDVLEIRDTKKGLVEVAVITTDPDLSASVANAAMEELEDFVNRNVLSVAKKNRAFVEEQLIKNAKELAASEEAFKAFQKQHRVLDIETNIATTEEVLGNMRRTILRKEVEKGVAKRRLAGNSPQTELLQQEIDVLRRKIVELELQEKQEKKEGQGKANIRGIPGMSDLAMQYLRRQRELLVREKINMLLTQQYEIARIEEVKDEPSVQVIDRAIPPYRRFRPSIRMNMLAALMASMFLSVLLAYFLEWRQGGSGEGEAVMKAVFIKK